MVPVPVPEAPAMPRSVIHYRNSAMSRLLPLLMAAREGREEEVVRLLEGGVDVNQADWTTLIGRGLSRYFALIGWDHDVASVSSVVP